MSIERFDIDKNTALKIEVSRSAEFSQRFRIERKLLATGAEWTTLFESWNNVSKGHVWKRELSSISAIATYRVTGQHKKGGEDWADDHDSKKNEFPNKIVLRFDDRKENSKDYNDKIITIFKS